MFHEETPTKIQNFVTHKAIVLPTGDWGLGECPPLTIRAPLARKLLDQFLSQALKNVIQMLQCGQQKYQKILSQMWWLVLVIPTVGKVTQGYC